MVDTAKRYNELGEEEKERFRRSVEAYQPQIPAYSPQAEEMTRDQERRDYQTARTIPLGTPGAFDDRLKRGVDKYGKARAVEDILDWAIRNE